MVALTAFTVAGTAASEEPAPPPLPARHRLVYENLFALRYNPLGIEDQVLVGYRGRLWDDPSPLFRDGWVGAYATPTFNPAVMRLGGTVEVKPLSVLALSAGTYYMRWFGSLGHVQGFPTATARHSDTDLDVGEAAGANVAASGFETQLRALVLAKVGPVAVRNDANLFFTQVDLEPGERVFYNVRIDALLPDSGFSLTNDTDVAWVSDFGLVLGVRNTITKAFYGDAAFLPGEDTDDPNTPMDRLGPIAAYTFFSEPGSIFDKPTVILIAQWWLAHRHRTGDDVSAGAPYIALAFRFEGELLGSD